MIKIHFDPKKLPKAKKKEWNDLLERARKGTLELIGEWEDFVDAIAAWRTNPVSEKPEFKLTKLDDDLWKDIRDWLLRNVFNNKCAYCETPVVRFIGDAEHFRPKGRVSIPVNEKRKKTAIVSVKDEAGSDVNHPGYFWLAYHWKNLLPACQVCNRNGKRDLFPVGKNHFLAMRLTPADVAKLKHPDTSLGRIADMFYLDPEDLDDIEGRLLLHPYFDTPAAHLAFGEDGGITARDDIGQLSIDLYKLEDPDLDKLRGKAQSDFALNYMARIFTNPGDIASKKKFAEGLIQDYILQGNPYVLAILDYLHIHLKDSPYDLRNEFLK